CALSVWRSRSQYAGDVPAPGRSNTCGTTTPCSPVRMRRAYADPSDEGRARSPWWGRCGRARVSSVDAEEDGMNRDTQQDLNEAAPTAEPVVPSAVPWRAVVVFTVLAIGLAWAACSPMWLSGQGLQDPRFGLWTIVM